MALVLYLLAWNRLEANERIIVALLAVIVITEQISYFFGSMENSINFIYNISIPVQRVLAMWIFMMDQKKVKVKRLFKAGMISILLVYAMGHLQEEPLKGFHYNSNSITAFILAGFSYFHLRSISLGSISSSRIIIMFTVASLVYSTLSISSMSAQPLAQIIDMEFALHIYAGNLIAYALWSTIIIIPLVWKAQKN
ncbi:MAG: hypothetical protein AAGC47_01980 [Bacteroidota bacterium]